MSEPLLAYSGWKIAHHPDVLADLRAGRLCRPSHLQLHLTARCNLACRHCINGGAIPRVQRPPAAELPTRLALDVVRDFADLGGRALEFTGGGEPTMHQEFFEVVDFALSRDLKVALITNGVMARDKLNDLATRADRFAWIRVSLDATTVEDYRRRKGGPDYAFAWATGTIGRLALRGANVGVSYLVDENTTTTEIRDAVEIARVHGARSIRFAPIYRESLPTSVAGATAAQIAQLALQDFLVVDMLPRRFADMAARFEHPDRKCGYLYASTVVAADGKVYACCFQAYMKGAELADLSQRTFAGWWNSKRRADLLRDWRCARQCNGIACWMRASNEIFHKLVEEIPSDLDFI